MEVEEILIILNKLLLIFISEGKLMISSLALFEYGFLSIVYLKAFIFIVFGSLDGGGSNQVMLYGNKKSDKKRKNTNKVM